MSNSVDEESPLAVEPAFLLDEVEEEQPREEQQRLTVGGFLRLPGQDAHRFRHVADRAAEAFEELARQRFAVEGAVEDARRIAAAGEEVETIERVRGGMIEIDVEPAGLASGGEIVNRQPLRIHADRDRLDQSVVRRQRTEECGDRVRFRKRIATDDVQVELRRA